MASIKSPRGGIGGMVSSPDEAADSMKKLAVVGISMILRQRFGISDENFTLVPFGLETFPALKKRSENKVAQNLCHPLHVIYDLINRRELKAFSLLVLRSENEPLDVLDNFRFKMKYSEDISNDEMSLIDSQVDISEQTNTVLVNLRKMLDELGEIGEEAFATVVIEQEHSRSVPSNLTDELLSISSSQIEDFKQLPKKKMGQVQSPYSWMSINAFSKRLFDSKVTVEAFTTSQQP